MTDLTLFTNGTAAVGDAPAAGVGTPGTEVAPAGAARGAGRGTRERTAPAGAARGAGRGTRERTAPAGAARGAGRGAATAGTRSSDEALAQAAALLDALVAALRSVGGELAEQRLELVGRCEARLASVRSDTVAELTRRDGEARAADAVRARLRKSRGAAKGDVKLAGQLADLPATAGALAGGAITPQHARIIAEASEHTDIDEAELLAAAESEPTDTFGRTVHDHVNEKSAEIDLHERRRRQRARRELSIKQQSDGMYKLFGLFDPVAGARIETALTAAARKLRNAEDPANRATVPQRYADALEQLATGNGSAGSQTTTLLVIADYDAVAGRVAGARLPDGTPVSADELVKLAVDAKVVPAVFDTPGRPLWLGRASRDANAAQRIALAARDGRCVGCGARHNICEPHHEKHWEHGGPTDIDNLCLLCGHCHHTEIHRNGADIDKTPDGKRTLRHAARHHPNTGRRRRNDTKHNRRDSPESTINQPLLL